MPSWHDVTRGHTRVAWARGRVGRTPEERFAWLIDFLARDFGVDRADLPREVAETAPEPTAAATAAEQRAVDEARWELLAFALIGWEEAPVPAVTREEVPGIEVPPESLWNAPAHLHPAPTLLDRDPTYAVRELQSEVRFALRSLATQGRMRLPFTVYGYRWTPGGIMVPIPLINEEEPGGVQSWVFGAVSALVNELADRLRVCKAAPCIRLFLRSGRREFCTENCANRVRSQHYRRENRSRVLEARRAAYRKRQQARLGLKVRIADRPRRDT